MITAKLITEAYMFLRTNNHSIPDEVLDFMKDVSLAALSQQNLKQTDVTSRLSDVMQKFGEVHNMIAKTSLPAKEYNPISQLFAEAKVELYNAFLHSKEETSKLIEFFEYVSNPSSEWFFRQGYWYKEGYKTRKTQELFEYYLACKERGINGC